MRRRHPVLTAFGLNVRRQREARRLTQEGLAEKADLDQTYISGIECGVRNPILNSMLLLSTVHSSDLAVKPGNLYLPRPALRLKCPIKRCGIKTSDLAESMPIKLTKDEQYKKLFDQSQKAKQKEDISQARPLERSMEKRKREILRACVPVLLEITPTCDHAQSKSSTARFLAGLLVPDEHAKLFDWEDRQPPFLRNMEPLIIPGRNGIWHLILNARTLHSITNSRRLVRSAPAARLREGVQSDIRTWFAAHAARPGYMSVR